MRTQITISFLGLLLTCFACTPYHYQELTPGENITLPPIKGEGAQAATTTSTQDNSSNDFSAITNSNSSDGGASAYDSGEIDSGEESDGSVAPDGSAPKEIIIDSSSSSESGAASSVEVHSSGSATSDADAMLPEWTRKSSYFESEGNQVFYFGVGSAKPKSASDEGDAVQLSDKKAINELNNLLKSRSIR